MLADVLQTQHRVGQAYQERLHTVRTTDPTVHDWQQLGVLASEFGESCWAMGRRKSAAAYWRQAAICYIRALRVPGVTAKQYFAVRCDQVRNQARLTRYDQNEKVFGQALAEMQALTFGSGDDHLTGISLHFYGAMLCGKLFGFPAEPNYAAALESFGESQTHFLGARQSSEVSQAFRSMQFTWATVLRATGAGITVMLSSIIDGAAADNDFGHVRRAEAFLQWGPQSQTVLRVIRDIRAPRVKTLDPTPARKEPVGV